jgi:hypothetical protein
MRNILIGVVSSAAMGAALLATAAPALADNFNWAPGYRALSDGNAGPGPYGIGGPGTGKVIAYNGWGRGYGYRAPGYGYGYGYGVPGYGYGATSDGNAGPGPYGVGGPGTGKVVGYNG